MLKYILPFISLFAIASCNSEDNLQPSIEYTNDFAIADSPNDSVQHERYLIYKEFGVPVYFNDTIHIRQNGTDAAGRPITYVERVDLNWTFSSYNHGVDYRYRFLDNDDDRYKSLQFVRAYLKEVSQPMRPFSILLADTLSVTSSNKVDKPLYHVGYRTLVFAQIKDLTDEETRTKTITSVIHSMIADRIKADREVCARFAEVSNAQGWYYREWKKMDNCETINKYQSLSWVVSVNGLYDQAPYNPYEHRDIVDVLTDPALGVEYNEAYEARLKMLTEMGAYGFLRGWKSSGTWSPADADEDRQYFIDALLELGDGGFRRRYGACPLVMEKYNYLHDFITEKLGVNLDYDNLTEDW